MATVAKNTGSPTLADAPSLPEPDRTVGRLRYLVEIGAVRRYGAFWQERQDVVDRLRRELGVIERQGFCSYFIILASILDFCRDEGIAYGPGRGSVGGSLVAYCVGIHEVDPLEWDLLFERFLNPERIAYPDVDIDISQRDRGRVIDYVRRTYEINDNLVLQVAAFASAGPRSVLQHVLTAMRDKQPDAEALGYILRDCIPDDPTGGTKQRRPLNFWIENQKSHGKVGKFKETAEQAGWLEPMLKLDGMYTNLARHAAGVVILSEDDLQNLPLAAVNNPDVSGEKIQVTGFDMYDLDRLGFLKIDMLGLRTLDVVCDAAKFAGMDGTIPELMNLWREHKDDPAPYSLLCDANTLGIFQMETDGYKRTLRDYQPDHFDDIVRLSALYRPGALDYKRESDGKNMVEVFIDRRRGNEDAEYPHESLVPVLKDTYGIFLYQEQSMRAAVELAGFTGAQADELRSAIGKKKLKVMDRLKPLFVEGALARGVDEAVVHRVWENIAAAARYSWNKSHAVEYAVITWWTVWFKYHHPAAFYAALFNSYEDNKDRLAHALSEARQKVRVSPPTINDAADGFIAKDGEIVFGLNGVKGLGEDGRAKILEERWVPYGSFQDFCLRLPSLPIDKKLALIKCGAFDKIDDRHWLLAKCLKSGKSEKTWTVAEHLNHNRNLKKPREVPPEDELTFASAMDLSKGEQETIGFYISDEPLAACAKAMDRLPGGNHIAGEIESIRRKRDKNDNEYANITLLTPALTRQRVRCFASNWPRYERWVEVGRQTAIRGRKDGDTFIADAFFDPTDVKHFRKIKTTHPVLGESTQEFDRRIETIEELEAAGYEVRLL